MPSPAIPRSTSDPYLSSALKTRVPPSNRSTCSTSRSKKSVYWFNWSNAKLGHLISIGRNSFDSSSSKHSDLTEESLEAHNRRQLQEAAVFDNSNVDDKNAKCSPYYKGLTDYSLIISREKHQYLPPSPGRESHATTIASSSSSISSFMFIKIQEWSACFSSFKSSSKDKQNQALLIALAPAPVQVQVTSPVSAPPVLVPCFAPPGPAGVNTITTEQGNPQYSSLPVESSTGRMPMKRKETDKDVSSVIIEEEKPLRERVSIAESKSPFATATSAQSVVRTETASISNVDEKNEIEMIDANKFTWADKYRPETLKDFICNRTTAAKMQGLIKETDRNHFIFEGHPGVGKRTMIRAMIEEAYQPDRIREDSKKFNLQEESVGSIDVKIKVSSHHIEVNLSDLKGYEKHVVVELIKQTDDRKSRNSLLRNDNCRAVVLYNADKLSADAVMYIKWLLERYKGSSKFFFCCSDDSKLQPLKELCTFVQLFLPSNQEIVEVLEYIAKQECLQLPRQFAERIAAESKNNLRQAIRSFEASWQQRSCSFTEDQEILTGWEDDIANIAKDMIQEQSPKQLYVIRGKLQSLIEHDVSPKFIFNALLVELKKHLDEFCQCQLDNLYKDYNRKDGNMLEGENQILLAHNRYEEAGKRFHDPSKKKFQKFMKIEGKLPNINYLTNFLFLGHFRQTNFTFFTFGRVHSKIYELVQVTYYH
ncbi:uncharacterized protein LOC126677119 isoform X2 [Mercurialis annua]|uniref:uncharacterized protein LOC126677119 isoform X2 n=1 Tax=Mercurialis annua TaxID=3986 RepID=UPI00215F35F9|nr:uncharacterized protein LOC126677119 isoform X2 [Mercurialis annua]